MGGLHFALGLRLGQGMLYYTTLSLRYGVSGWSFFNYWFWNYINSI